MSDFLKSIGSIGSHSLEAAKLEQQQATLEKAKGLTPAEQIKMEQAAKDFEGLLLQQMMKSMWSTVQTEGSLLGSKEEEMYRDMFNQAMADHISEHNGIGIKDVIIRDFKKIEGS